MEIVEREKKNNIRNSGDRKISIAVMAPFVVLMVQYFILILFNGKGNLIVQFTSKILVAIVYIYVLPIVLKRKVVLFISTYFIALFIILINLILFPENYPYIIEIIFPLFFMSLPAFIYIKSLDNWSVLRDTMKKASFIVYIFGMSIGFLVFFDNAQLGNYSMALSYYMLLPTLIYLDEFLEKPSLKTTLFVFLSLLIIIALGSRGAVMCVLVFTVLKVIGTNFKITRRRIIVNILFLYTVIVILFFSDEILKALYDLFLKFGIRSRTLEILLLDKFYLSGREFIYRNVIEGILSSPFIGIGIGGDRRVSGGEGFYAHNLFLEVIANFGLIIGGVLLITLLFLIIKTFLIKGKEEYNMAIIWLSMGLIPLMVSGSYLTDIKFWIFIGIITNLRTKN